MELLCAERVSPGSEVRAAPAAVASADPVLLQRRVLDNLLRTEERYAVTASYFGTVQTEVTPHMRRVVAEWMLELCEEQNCQEDVFPLAISYLDRFLSTCAVGKSQLQLLGTVCLLLASKLREPSSHGLTAETLVFYTANSVTYADICTWELLVLSKLKWDIAGVTAHDFLPLLLSRLHLPRKVNTEMVQRHAQTFISLAGRDYKFTLYSASTLAAACLSAALRGLCTDTAHLLRLQELTGIDLDCLHTCLENVEVMVQAAIAATRQAPGPNCPGREEPTRWTPPPQDKAHSNAATPTDIRDVQF